MDIWGRITNISGNKVTMSVEDAQELAMLSLYTSEERPQAVISIADERSISRVQRKKAYAIIGEIAKWSGYTPEETKWWMKFYYEAETGDQHFSFADTDMTTARTFISYLLDYAVKNHIPMSKSGLAYMDDVEAYMYSSLSHRSCVVCGRPADVHHIDTVGMGNDRNLVDHRQKHLIALCRVHHNEAHNIGWPAFEQNYHVKGIKLDPETLQRLGIMTFKRMEEIDNDKSRRISRTTNQGR